MIFFVLINNWLGILLFELFHSKAPFKGRRVEDVKSKIKIGKIVFRRDLETPIRDMIKEMLQIDPKKRPHVSEILKAPFIQEVKAKLDADFFDLQNKPLNNEANSRFKPQVLPNFNNFNPTSFLKKEKLNKKVDKPNNLTATNFSSIRDHKIKIQNVPKFNQTQSGPGFNQIQNYSSIDTSGNAKTFQSNPVISQSFHTQYKKSNTQKYPSGHFKKSQGSTQSTKFSKSFVVNNSATNL